MNLPTHVIKKSHIEQLEKRLEELEEESQELDAQLAQLKSQQGSSSQEDEGEDSVPLTPSMFIETIEKINALLSSEATLTRAKIIAANTEQNLPESITDPDEILRRKLRAVDNFVLREQDSFWTEQGVSAEKGQSMTHEFGYHIFADVSEEVREQLQEAVSALVQIEERVVIAGVYGEEAYEQQQKEDAEMEAAMKLVQDGLSTGDMQERQRFAMRLQSEASAVFKNKLSKATNRDEMSKIFGELSEEERMSMMQFQCLQQLVGNLGGGHGHSHGGQPCHGHSHGGEEEEEDHGHGHSHGGHGHSHGGQPCHGHSHGESDEDEDEEEEEEEEHGHGHSHGGQPCHGHSHSHE